MIYYQGVVLGLLSLGTLAATAAPSYWQIVPAESQLTFTATQNGAAVTGSFKNFTGTIYVDPNDVTVGNIDIQVDINSLIVSYADLQKTLLSPEWFNPAKFPKAEFKSSEFKKTGNNTYEAKGTLSIRDKSQPVVLSFTAAPLNAERNEVTGSAMIRRNDFGVGQGEWASTNDIKNEVTIKFKVVAVKENKK